MTEISIQSQCFQWLWNEHPETRYCFFAVPNGGTRNMREAMGMKASGTVAGVSDCIFFWKGEMYCIEFKADVGKQSDKQINFQNAIRAQGAYYFIVRSFETFVEMMTNIIANR